MKLNLAGKIAPHDWRSKVVPNVHKLDEHSWNEVVTLPIHSGHLYTVPFFVACDHGCGHTNSGHGAVSLCNGALLATRKTVYEKARRGIRLADLVIVCVGEDFATAHGTHFEAGYASGLAKNIVLLVKHGVTLDEHWFVASGAALTVYCDEFEDGAMSILKMQKSVK